jgi:hypothetical protein
MSADAGAMEMFPSQCRTDFERSRILSSQVSRCGVCAMRISFVGLSYLIACVAEWLNRGSRIEAHRVLCVLL